MAYFKGKYRALVQRLFKIENSFYFLKIRTFTIFDVIDCGKQALKSMEVYE